MIDFEHVSKEYKKGGRLALEDISLHVEEGEFVFLLGHSGAGKSTLLKLILREELPTSGKVTVLGKDIAKLRRRKIPYLRRHVPEHGQRIDAVLGEFRVGRQAARFGIGHLAELNQRRGGERKNEC